MVEKREPLNSVSHKCNIFLPCSVATCLSFGGIFVDDFVAQFAAESQHFENQSAFI